MPRARSRPSPSRAEVAIEFRPRTRSTRIKGLKEFKTALTAEPLDKVLVERVFGGEVAAFNGNAKVLPRLQAILLDRLKPASGQLELLVVGSAKTGFSLSPAKPFAPFHPRSDIDLAVISADLFDHAWHVLLAWNYVQPEKHWPRHGAGHWVGQRRDDLWWGYLRPAEWTTSAHRSGLLKEQTARQSFGPVKSLSSDWLNTLNALAKDPALKLRDVKGRLYRSKEHAARYHTDSLAKLKATVTAQA